MYVRPNEREDTRIGISVSKKVGNSIIRHRVTRVIRECCRLHEEEVKKGLDIVIVARQLAKEQGLMDMETAFFHLGRKHHIFLESK
jgi:ribonuclease P protein component